MRATEPGEPPAPVRRAPGEAGPPARAAPSNAAPLHSRCTLLNLQRGVGNAQVQRFLAVSVQRDGEPVTQFSGYYEGEQDVPGGRLRTALFLNVNGVTVVGRFRTFFAGEDGRYQATGGGPLRGERTSTSDTVRYEAAGPDGPWMLEFDVPSRSPLAALARVPRTIPLRVTGLDGVPHRFSRRGDAPPAAMAAERDIPSDRAGEVADQRQGGLTPAMRADLEAGAVALLAELRAHSRDSGVNEVGRAAVLDHYLEVLSPYGGGLRERAEAFLLRRLARHRVILFGEELRADHALSESVASARAETGSREGGLTFSYTVQFRGVQVQARVVAGVQLASGAVQVTAYRARRTESTTEVAWTRPYTFAEIRVSGGAGGGLGAGASWQTFHTQSPVEWTQEDFGNAAINVFGVQGPTGQVALGVGPVGVNLADATVYQFSGMALQSGAKTLELSAQERVNDSSSMLNQESGQVQTRDQEAQRRRRTGLVGEGHLVKVESGLGHLAGRRGVAYDAERQQGEPLAERPGPVDVVPSAARGGFDRSSSAPGRAMLVEVTARLGRYQHLVRDPDVPLRVVGHASSYWSGGGDPRAGNQELSQDRAEAVARLLRVAFELDPDRVIDVSARGDTLARAAGGRIRDDNPLFRRVDVLVGGTVTIPLHY